MSGLEVMDSLIAGVVPASPLPAGLTLASLRDVMGFDDEPLGTELLGDGVETDRWQTDSDLYQGGLVAYVDDDGLVVSVVGYDPFDERLEAPEADEATLDRFGEPDLVLDAALGGLVLAGSERVWVDRGLFVRTNPGNDLLLVMGVFAPTTTQDYLARIRPDASPRTRMVDAFETGRWP